MTLYSLEGLDGMGCRTCGGGYNPALFGLSGLPGINEIKDKAAAVIAGINVVQIGELVNNVSKGDFSNLVSIARNIGQELCPGINTIDDNTVADSLYSSWMQRGFDLSNAGESLSSIVTGSIDGLCRQIESQSAAGTPTGQAVETESWLGRNWYWVLGGGLVLTYLILK